MIRLNASALPRVLACLGSTQFPNTHDSEQSEAAREGEAAHQAAEHALKGLPIPPLASNGYAIDAEMIEHAQAYRVSMLGLPTNDQAWIEARCDWLATSQIEIACKIDAAWVSGRTLHVRDYKYGWRIVEPESNVQLIAYAVGLLRNLAAAGKTFPSTLAIDLGIYQPRPYHPDGPLRTWKLSFSELFEAHNALVADLGNLPSDTLATGTHCEHCPGGTLGTCPAYLQVVGNSIDVAMRGGPMDPTPAQIGRELVTLKRAADVLKQRKEWLEDIAKRGLKAGTIIPGWAVEQAKGNTVWTVDADGLKRLTNIDVLAPEKLCTPAEAKRRGVSDEVIAANTTRPNIGDRLVRRDPDAYVRKRVGKKGKGDA